MECDGIYSLVHSTDLLSLLQWISYGHHKWATVFFCCCSFVYFTLSLYLRLRDVGLFGCDQVRDQKMMKLE